MPLKQLAAALDALADACGDPQGFHSLQHAVDADLKGRLADSPCRMILAFSSSSVVASSAVLLKTPVLCDETHSFHLNACMHAPTWPCVLGRAAWRANGACPFRYAGPHCKACKLLGCLEAPMHLQSQRLPAWPPREACFLLLLITQHKRHESDVHQGNGQCPSL